jgi:hypothetical protein
MPDGAGAVVSAIDSMGRTIWILDAHRGDGKRFIVRADQKLTAFLELERAIRQWSTCKNTIDLSGDASHSRVALS